MTVTTLFNFSMYRSTCRVAAVTVLSVLVQACATDALKNAPQAADKPWQPFVEQDATPQTKPTASKGLDFSVPANSRVSQIRPAPVLLSDHSYSLYELIDIAQRENPSTRLAWNTARQAALTQGMVEATFLPIISARVIGGWGHSRSPINLPFMGETDINVRAQGVVPALALEWLLFDFGQRRALAAGAGHLSDAANVLFNAAHQKVIRDVTHSYYQYGLSRERVRITEQSYRNAQQVAQAVQERYQAGVGTSVESAIATQHVAQARLRKVTAEGVHTTAYQNVLAAVGLPGNSQIALSTQMSRPLEHISAELADEAIEQALSQRPDVLASYSALQAAQEGVKAAEAEFAPKVFVAGVVAHTRSEFGVNNLPDWQRRSFPSALMVGLNLPIFDSGLRAARLKDAQISVSKAEDMFQKLQQDAMREMIAMHSLLRSALAAYQAAGELEQAAQIAYDAALDAYKYGVGTITLAHEASSGLLDAQLARADAHVAALNAAADLAFLMGDMTSAPQP